MEEAIAFTRELSAVEGLRTDELDLLLSNPPGESGLATSDPLASVAWEYAVRVAHLTTPVALEIASAAPSPSSSGPEPMEILVWYHLRIYLRVVRALVSREASSAGAATDDARGCAKLALVSIERSHSALDWLRGIGGERAERAADPLIALLDTLASGLDERFPDARSFVRVGLDCPVA